MRNLLIDLEESLLQRILDVKRCCEDSDENVAVACSQISFRNVGLKSSTDFFIS